MGAAAGGRGPAPPRDRRRRGRRGAGRRLRRRAPPGPTWPRRDGFVDEIVARRDPRADRLRPGGRLMTAAAAPELGYAQRHRGRDPRRRPRGAGRGAATTRSRWTRSRGARSSAAPPSTSTSPTSARSSTGSSSRRSARCTSPPRPTSRATASRAASCACAGRRRRGRQPPRPSPAASRCQLSGRRASTCPTRWAPYITRFVERAEARIARDQERGIAPATSRRGSPRRRCSRWSRTTSCASSCSAAATATESIRVLAELWWRAGSPSRVTTASAMSARRGGTGCRRRARCPAPRRGRACARRPRPPRRAPRASRRPSSPAGRQTRRAARSGVALEVAGLAGAPHRAEPHIAVDNVGLGAGDPRGAVPAQRGHRLVLVRLQELPDGGRELRLLRLDVGPACHGSMVGPRTGRRRHRRHARRAIGRRFPHGPPRAFTRTSRGTTRARSPAPRSAAGGRISTPSSEASSTPSRGDSDRADRRV